MDENETQGRPPPSPTPGEGIRIIGAEEAASAPDLEHIVRIARPGGRKLFHGRWGWHRSGAFPAAVQLVLAGAIVGYLLSPRR